MVQRRATKMVPGNMISTKLYLTGKFNINKDNFFEISLLAHEDWNELPAEIMVFESDSTYFKNKLDKHWIEKLDKLLHVFRVCIYREAFFFAEIHYYYYIP